MTCDFLLKNDYDWDEKKATLDDIENGHVKRCGGETNFNDDYLNIVIDDESYPVDLCKKHKNRKITDEMVLKNHELLCEDRNWN